MENKVKFKPLGEKVLVEAHSAEEEVNGGTWVLRTTGRVQ